MIPTEEEISARLQEHIKAGDFPGAVVAVAEGGEITRLVAAGQASVVPPYSMNKDTVFDVASLTKPLITTTAILLLSQNGDLPLYTALGEIYENAPADKAGISIVDLLVHRSGFEAWYPLYAAGRSTAEYSEFILEHPLAAEPQSAAIYSDLNFVLLADIVEKIKAAPFSECVSDIILKPLGLQRSYIGKAPLLPEEIAATEKDGAHEQKMAAERGAIPLHRQGIIRGETHDGNSWAAGGCAGNAGLFSTARDVLKLTEEYGPRATLLSPEMYALVGENLSAFSSTHRTLGWQLASSEGCSAGPAFSPNAIGHTGFTGTSVWFDRERDIAVVILTNRVHPRCADINMNEIRRRLHTFLINGG